MNFVNTHPELVGKHALFSASKYAWLNYDDKDIASAYINSFAAPIGTATHEFAKKYISRRIPLTDDQGSKNALFMHLIEENNIPANVISLDTLFYNLMPYVNDSIGYKMTPEALVYYSDISYGWADAIGYSRNILRIHDLKTGIGKVSMDQLMIYAAIFYLEHKKEANLNKSRTELRIYKNQEVVVHTPSNHEIAAVMDKVIHANTVVDEIR